MYNNYLKNKSKKKHLTDELIAELEHICGPSKDLTLVSVETKPLFWIIFRDEDGLNILQPDLYVATSYIDYIDHWFIEIDQGNESESDVIEKCLDYLKYFQTAVWEEESDLFPVVVWLAKDEARKEQFRRAITEGLPPHHKTFLVITRNELEKMLRQMIGTEELC